MEYAFTFTFASQELPPISVSCIVYDSTALIGLVTLTFDLLTSKIGLWVTHVMCFYLAIYELLRLFLSRVWSRHTTDRQTPPIIS